MKLIEGSLNSLPATVHVEQDGGWFFILPHRHDYDTAGEFTRSLAIVNTGMTVGFDDKSGKAAQDAIRAYLIGLGTNPSFDY